jgi:hypothetical protein
MQIDELSDRTGESVERLREWWSLGLIGDRAADAFSASVVGLPLMVWALRRHPLILGTRAVHERSV